MEWLNAGNIVMAVIVLLMIGCVVKLFTCDIGTNKTFYILALIGLGMGLYLWRSGAVAELVTSMLGAVK